MAFLDTAKLVLAVFTVCILLMQIHCSTSTSVTPSSVSTDPSISASTPTDPSKSASTSTAAPTTSTVSPSPTSSNAATSVSASSSVSGASSTSAGGTTKPAESPSTGNPTVSSSKVPTTTQTPSTTEKPVCYNQTCNGTFECIDSSGETCDKGSGVCFQKVFSNGTYDGVTVGCATTCVAVVTTAGTNYTETIECCSTSKCNKEKLPLPGGGKGGSSSTRPAGVAMTILSVLFVMLS